jgi:hypothetical protein
MKKVLTLSAAIIGLLLLLLGLVGNGGNWPAVENPPGQGEALDPRRLQLGQVSHSAVATGRLIREPQNTWSNLAFVFAGAYLACCARLRMSRLAGVALIAVGVGSFVYHASASRALRHLDVAAVYGLFFVTTLLAAGCIQARWRTRLEAYAAFWATAGVAFAIIATGARNVLVLGVKPLALSTVTAAASSMFVGALVFLAGRCHSRRAAFGVGATVALLLAAVACQLGDRPGGWLLNPEAAVQAHALWHVFASAAVFVGVRLIDASPPPDAVCRPQRDETNSRTRSGASG